MVLKIGDFSSKVNIPVKTLRYYDEIGILKPNLVDKFTGYRYYDDDNLLDVQTIKLLKSLGFSLKEIKEYFDALNSDGGGVSEILERKSDEILETLEKLEKRYDMINALKRKMRGKVLKLERLYR